MSKRMVIAGVAVFVAVAIWGVLFVRHMAADRDAPNAELQDFLKLRTQVRKTLLAHANQLPDGMVSKSGRVPESHALFPPQEHIEISVRSSGHWAQTATNHVEIAIDKERLAGPGLSLVAHEIVEHFTEGLAAKGAPPITRQIKTGPFSYRISQVSAGLSRKTSASLLEHGTALNEEVWSSDDGTVTVLLRVLIDQDAGRANVTWYIVERF